LVLTPFINGGLLQADSSNLFRQGYQYYLGLGERTPLSKEELDIRLSNINSLEDYENNIDFSRLDSSNETIVSLRSTKYFMEKIRNLLFLIQILIQMFNAIFVFRLAEIRLSGDLK
jgi:hypothetical protein